MLAAPQGGIRNGHGHEKDLRHDPKMESTQKSSSAGNGAWLFSAWTDPSCHNESSYFYFAMKDLVNHYKVGSDPSENTTKETYAELEVILDCDETSVTRAYFSVYDDNTDLTTRVDKKLATESFDLKWEASYFKDTCYWDCYSYSWNATTWNETWNETDWETRNETYCGYMNCTSNSFSLKEVHLSGTFVAIGPAETYSYSWKHTGKGYSYGGNDADTERPATATLSLVLDGEDFTFPADAGIEATIDRLQWANKGPLF